MKVKNRCALIAALILAVQFYACRADISAANVDIDLSRANAIIAFSQVSKMYAEPWNYVNAVIRVRGTLDACVKDNGQECSMVMVRDATACCGQGIEFVRRNDDTSQNSCPEYGNEVIVTGRFELYQEDGNTFIHLVDADVEQEYYKEQNK